MIRRLRLENWRNYERADLPLTGGTTFVVASNGVGKTSFVEAARWALFGSPLSTSPARVGSERTSATVEVVLPDGTTLTAARIWDSRKTKPTHQVAMTRHGRDLTPTEWESLCLELYGCSTDLLEHLTMPAPGPVAPSGLGLHEHLSSLYRIDDLNAAAARLTQELKAVAKDIAGVKNANAVKAAEFQALQTQLKAAVELLDTTHKNLARSESTLQLARKRDDQLERAAARLAEQTRLDADHADLIQRLTELLGASVNTDQARELLDQRLADARSNLDALRLEGQLTSHRRQAIERDLAGLDAATDDCPTCRRPLDPETREHAHTLWRSELADLNTREASAHEAEPAALARVATLEHAQRELVAIAQRRAALAGQASEDAVDAPSSDEATQAYRTAVEAEALARQAHQQAEVALQEAREADQNMRKLEGLFAREARFEIAKKAAEATREEVLNEIVGPLAEAINDRWASLFPNRGHVSTGPDGTISRNLGDHELTFESFSTAEGTAAVIIMRLLVAQMTTKARFAWFDEPLEHLDPDVRRNVASLLTRITTEGTLDQVVVTTYEETLARNLYERSPNRTRLLDVRQELQAGDLSA
jgi:DNA repair exonuclease SbcCD ATPase subunit